MRSYRVIAILLFSAVSLCNGQQSDPAGLVDPFIGTGGHGHTFPGATFPFGMVQLSPDTRVVGWDACGGYYHADRSILGFSHTHLSGTGVGDYGDILFSPMVGSVRLDTGSLASPGYRSAFRHEDEEASPGYYRVFLREKQITVELTATRRTGVHRYTFPQTDSAWLVIDLVHGIGPDKVRDAWLEVTGEREVTGFRRSKGWALDQHIYFVAHFSQPIASFGISGSDTLAPDVARAAGRHVKGALRFRSAGDEPLIVRVGISATDASGARRNLEQEMQHRDFDAVRQSAYDTWNRSLSRIRLSGGTIEQRRTFYTALYHTMIAPNVFSDVDGRYRTMTGGIGTADGFERYTVFSLWDTFRAAHPLFTILEPDRTADFIRSFLAIYEESLGLPVWELAANETWCMIGYHAVPPILDAYRKGIRGFDPAGALAAMVGTAKLDTLGRLPYGVYGCIPSEKESESVSKTLEYAYDDWCISEMARLLGRDDLSEEFARRAESYRNLFDPSAGFFRSKRNGAWKEPFTPRAVTVDFTEANAWQYAFFVPHNVSGMIDLYGGREGFTRKLDEMFAAQSVLEGRDQADITGLIGQYAHGNEPSHHIAYLYAYAGQPWRTQQLVRRIMQDFYTDAPDGLIGNEDCGQMSAWYVLSALGLYPVNPAQPIYTLGAPLFPEARVQLPNGRELVIAGKGAETNPYVQEVFADGRALGRSWISHDELLNTDVVSFSLGSVPDTSWASHPGSVPPSPPAAPITLAPVSSRQEQSFQGSITVELSCATPGAVIRYSTDGSEPGRTSAAYSVPLTFDRTTTLKARAYAEGLPPSGVLEAVYEKFERIGHVLSTSPYSSHYDAGGDQAIMDGVHGVIDFRIGGWQGYEGNDMQAVIDLGEVRLVSSISTTFLHDNNAWIFFPAHVTYEVSTDGRLYSEILSQGSIVAAHDVPARIQDVQYAGPPHQARFVRVTAKNIGTCPPWHKGSGGKAWIFVDEVEIR